MVRCASGSRSTAIREKRGRRRRPVGTVDLHQRPPRDVADGAGRAGVVRELDEDAPSILDVGATAGRFAAIPCGRKAPPRARAHQRDVVQEARGLPRAPLGSLRGTNARGLLGPFASVECARVRHVADAIRRQRHGVRSLRRLWGRGRSFGWKRSRTCRGQRHRLKCDHQRDEQYVRGFPHDRGAIRFLHDCPHEPCMYDVRRLE